MNALRKLDSTVVLERLDSTTSTHAYVRRAESACEDGRRGEYASPVALELSIRFGRLGAVTVLVVGGLMALTIVFHRGVVLGHFDPTGKNDDAKKQLLDDYNSYTGNVAALFGRPIELFVSLAVQLVLLRVLAASLLRAQLSWKLNALALALGASVAFLLNNGLNALNVQAQPPTIEPLISAVDLRYKPEFSVADAPERSTNLTHTFSERTTRNPITNTVLRNLVLPRVPVTTPYCDWQKSQQDVNYHFLPDLGLEYGFSQREWQGRLLQQALEPKQLRVVVDATIETASQDVDTTSLPMNASLAAELFLYSILVTPYLFPWSQNIEFGDDDEIQRRYPDGKNLPDSYARVYGLLPPATSAADETAQRQWFLRESTTALKRHLNGAKNASTSFIAMNTSRSGVVMEFSHVDISATVRFDAVTIEFEVDPNAFSAEITSEDNNATRYRNMNPPMQCGPWPMRCLMRKPRLVSIFEGAIYDPSARVVAFGSCVNAKGAEEVTLADWTNRLTLDCERISTTSFMVMSIGKRFLAESITENRTVNVSGLADQPESAVIKNLRRIYTYTVGRLSWDLSDLTADFSAKCAASAGTCQGLHFPLAPAMTNPQQQQEIIVGTDALPTSLITPPKLQWAPRFVPLVKLHEPSPTVNGYIDVPELYDTIAGDPLLPHNMGAITWDMEEPLPANKSKCNALIEERLQLILNNHMYIEHGFQTAYTAATFFLLQNGVVKDVVQLNDKAQRESLNFQYNSLRVTLLASIPDQNAWLTLAGCVVLLLSLGSVVAWAWATTSSKRTSTGDGRSRGVGLVTTPHVVARVMLDAVRFPPLFLHRRVVGAASPDSDDLAPTVDGFVIDGLTLQPPPAEKAAL